MRIVYYSSCNWSRANVCHLVSIFLECLDDCKWKKKKKQKKNQKEKGKPVGPIIDLCSTDVVSWQSWILFRYTQLERFLSSQRGRTIKHIRGNEESHCWWFSQHGIGHIENKWTFFSFNIRITSILWYCILYYYFVSQYHRKWVLYLYGAIFIVLCPGYRLISLTRVHCPFPVFDKIKKYSCVGIKQFNDYSGHQTLNIIIIIIPIYYVCTS